MRPDNRLCPHRDLSIAEFGASEDSDRARELLQRSAAIPLEYHLSEDPSDAELGIVGVRTHGPHWIERVDWERLQAKCSGWVPGRFWHWLVFFYSCIVFFLGLILGRLLGGE